MDNNEVIKQVEDYLTRYGDSLVTGIRKALKEHNKLATGNLYNSVQFKVTTADKVVILEVQANDYIQWIDQGRRAGSKMPPISAIKEWIELRGIRMRGVPVEKEKTPENQERLAFLIARSIGRKGIPATGVVQNPFNQSKKKAASDISQIIAKGNHDATGRMLQDLSKQYQNNNIKIEIQY